jgi:hypothetical protein
LSEGGVPLDGIALAGKDNGLWVVEDTEEGDPTEGLERIEEGADECLLLLVRNDLDIHPARPLEAGGEEVEDLGGLVLLTDSNGAKVVLGGFPDQPVEEDQGGRADGLAKPTHELVDRVLAPVVSLEKEEPQDLNGGKVRPFLHDLPGLPLEVFGDGRTPHLRFGRRCDFSAPEDSPDGVTGDPAFRATWRMDSPAL